MRNSDIANVALPLKELPLDIYRAIHQSITSKPDRIEKNYSGAFSADKGAIEDLVHRLEQSMQSIKADSSSVTIHCSLKNDSSQRFQSLKSFQGFNLKSNPHQTVGFSVSLDFVFAEQKPDGSLKSDPYKAQLVFMQRDEDVMVGEAIYRELTRSNFEDAKIIVDYVDYSIGRHLIAVMEEWLNGLPNDDQEGECRRRLSKWGQASEATPIVAFVASLVMSALFDISGAEGEVTSPIRYLLLSLALAIVFAFVAARISAFALKLKALSSPRATIELTKGDENLISRWNRDIDRSRGLFGLALISVGLAFVVNLGAAYVAAKLFS